MHGVRYVVVLGLALAVTALARAQDAPDAGVASEDAAIVAPPDVDGAAADSDASVVTDTDAAVPRTSLPRAIVVDAAPYGVDPVVGTFVSRAMRQTAAELGYEIVSPEETVAAAQAMSMPYPPTPADLWRVTQSAGAVRGAFARVWAFQGQYVVEITVASTDGGGPFFARGNAPAETLAGVVADLLRQALPPPGVRTVPVNVTPPVVTPPQTNTPPPVASPVRRRHHGTGHARHWAVVGVLDAAFGLSQDFFFNFLAGARLDYRITSDIRVGVGALGALLRGKAGLAGNVLFLAQLEDRLRVASDSEVSVPLRIAIGYLPFNGPFFRLAAGVSIPFADRWEITLDILSVDFWVLPDHTVASLDLGVEIGARF